MRLIESICIQGGQPQRLALHQQRVKRAFTECFPGAEALSLVDIFQTEKLPPVGTHKARLVYGRDGLVELSFAEYVPRQHRRIGLVEAPGFRYPHKLEDRSFFQNLFRLHPSLDDFIILHNGLLTDSTYCNLAVLDGDRWLTPAGCLLPGTRRAALLEEGVLQEARLEAGQLSSFKKIAFINAMRGLELAVEMAEVEFVLINS